MDNHRAGYSFAVLGLASLVGAFASLGWAGSLGGYRFIVATLGIFLALLSFTRVAELRRAAIAARPVPMPVPMRESIRGPIPLSTREREDEELAARLAALRAGKRPTAEPQEPFSFEAEPREEDSGMTVIEGPPTEAEDEAFEPVAAAELAQLAEAVAPVQPVAPPSGSMRQMDELRAEIARLREGARLRHAASTRGASLPSAELAPTAESHDQFERTEFTGLADHPREGAAFTKTEYLVPIELPRQ